MSVEAVTRLRCDDRRSRDCLRSFEAVTGPKETRRLARFIGWAHHRGIVADVCPACEVLR